ncbi:MAG: amidohydrolase [Anaerolineales bacterium]|nr:amidohydrolase [Anaerolineales bacterium]
MLDKANAIQQKLVEWRRDFHMYPELSFKETRTAGRIAEIMVELGYRVRTGVGKTGVVADLGEGSPMVAIRADMDALPIQDAKDVPYASRVPGVMHACGHDAHVAMGLGAATLLVREKFPGTVRFLFQPSEEAEDDEGFSGAPRMVQDGAMEGVDGVIALHVDSQVTTGDIEVAAGPVAAGCDTLYATITGKGGHGSAPHMAIDPVYIAAHVVLALNNIVSRRLSPLDAAVIGIGSIHGGQAPNVIPQQVELSATIRYQKTETQEKIHQEIERALEIARTLGGEVDFKIVVGNPPMINDAVMTDLFRQVGKEILGEEHIKEGEPEMGSEDFGEFSNLAQGSMFMLGCQIEGDDRFHHHPRFDVDERCLPIGVAMLTQSALHFLNK